MFAGNSTQPGLLNATASSSNPQRPGGLLGRARQPGGLLSEEGWLNPDRRARLAMAMEGMTLNPNQGLMQSLQADIEGRATARTDAEAEAAQQERLQHLAGIIGRTNPELAEVLLAGGAEGPVLAQYLEQANGSGEGSSTRASEILPDGTLIQSTDDGPRVFSPSGELLTGEAAAAAIMAARQFGVQNQQDIYNGRGVGSLSAEVELGAAAASATAAGSALGGSSVEAGVGAWEAYGRLQTSVGNIDEAIAALDRGAESGLVYDMLPRVSEAGASLQNAMDRMGLDVVGSVTFGALSEAEMRLAMSTAVPRGLDAAELRVWLERRRTAQISAARTMAAAAEYLTTPGNTINGWVAENRQRMEDQPDDPPPPDPSVPDPTPEETPDPSVPPAMPTGLNISGRPMNEEEWNRAWQGMTPEQRAMFQ